MNFLNGKHRAHSPANWRRFGCFCATAAVLLIFGLAFSGCDEEDSGPASIKARSTLLPNGKIVWGVVPDTVDPASSDSTGTPPYYPFAYRQSNCSLTRVVIDSTYTQVSQTPNYQDFLHLYSGSTTVADKFANGCKDPTTGITSQAGAMLGKLSNGNTVIGIVSGDGVDTFVISSTGATVSQQDYPTIPAGDQSGAVFGIASADLNGDGIPDIVVATETDQSDATLTVFLGKGDGTFTQKQTIAVSLNQSSSTAGPVIGVTIDDVNGDGNQDLIAVTNPISADSGITVFLGKGDGTFPSSGIAAPAGAGGQTAVTADFNGDGKKDVATSYGQILLGKGDGTFTLVSQSIPELNGSAAIAAADFNQDGKVDLAFLHQSGSTADVYFGNGNGTFNFSTAYPAIMSGYSLQSSDLDGDGFPDLFVGTAQGGVFTEDRSTSGFFQSILNQGDGTFGKSRAYFTSTPLNSFATLYDVADFTGDGKPDLVFLGSVDGTGTGTPNLTVLKNAGDGTFQLSGTQSSITGPDYVSSVPAIAAGDLTGSGKNDVVFAWGSDLSVAMGNGDGTFQPQQDYSIPAQVIGSNGIAANPLLLVDVNGDKEPDAVFIASADGSLNGTGLYVMLNNGDGTFGQAKLIDSEPYMSYLAAQDVNGDGKMDIVVSTAGDIGSATPGTGFLYLGNGDGTFQNATSLNPGGLYSQVVAIADLNGDGKPDLVFAGINATGSAESLTVLLGNGNGTFQQGKSTAVSANDSPTGIVVADGNLDGMLDVVLGGSSPYYAQGNGDGTFDATNSGNFYLGLNGKHLKAADLTGQGLPSLLMTSGATIQVFVAAAPPATTTASTTTTLQASATSIAAGQSATFTATVAPQSGSGTPTGTVTFVDGTTNIGTGTLNGSGVATFATSSLAAGTHSIAAVYGGDTNYAASTSASVTVTVTAAAPADFSIAASPASQTISPGQSATYTLTITPQNGFNQATSFACSGLPSESACSFSPASVTPNGTAASTSTLTITTTAPSNTSRNIPAWPFGGGGIVAA